MATEENPPQVAAAVLARRASPPAAGSRTAADARHANSSQEVWQSSDLLWQSKRRGSPSLLFHRKLSCDSGKGTILDEEYECLDYDSTLERRSPELPAGRRMEGLTDAVSAIPGRASEGSRRQLDAPGEGGDVRRNRTGSTRCSGTLSGLNTSPKLSCCRSARSSPAQSPSLCRAQANRRDVRRSSLPVSMLAFHKVTKKDVARPRYLQLVCIFPCSAFSALNPNLNKRLAHFLHSILNA